MAADPLSQPTRAAIVRLLEELRRPARTDELAARLGLHPNGIRLHLERLRTAGIVERRSVAGARGRPRHEWTLSAEPAPGRPAPTAYRDLARWLVRAGGADPAALERAEAAGEEIGRDAIGDAAGQPAPAALRTLLTALRFQPAAGDDEPGRTRYVLRNCPYRDAVAGDRSLVCVLHRGMTRGMLERIAPEARLAAFVPRDPYQAGCLIDVEWSAAS